MESVDERDAKAHCHGANRLEGVRVVRMEDLGTRPAQRGLQPPAMREESKERQVRPPTGNPMHGGAGALVRSWQAWAGVRDDRDRIAGVDERAGLPLDPRVVREGIANEHCDAGQRSRAV